jgi:hypothetical protein
VCKSGRRILSDSDDSDVRELRALTMGAAERAVSREERDWLKSVTLK